MTWNGNEKQKPTTDEYRSNWDKIFGGSGKTCTNSESKFKTHMVKVSRERKRNKERKDSSDGGET